MKKIDSLNEFINETGTNENVWLLLYKKDSEQSECAFKNYIKAETISKKNNNNFVLCHSNVGEVRDIHIEFGITSVPALLHFEKGQLKNVIKGCHKPEQFNVIFDKSAVVLQTGDNNKPHKNVIVYTTPTCSWCNTIKRHFQENGIRYREIVVSCNPKDAEEMIRKSGQQGVPQTDINGEIIVGFDKARINRLLGIN